MYTNSDLFYCSKESHFRSINSFDNNCLSCKNYLLNGVYAHAELQQKQLIECQAEKNTRAAKQAQRDLEEQGVKQEQNSEHNHNYHDSLPPHMHPGNLDDPAVSDEDKALLKTVCEKILEVKMERCSLCREH